MKQLSKLYPCILEAGPTHFNHSEIEEMLILNKRFWNVGEQNCTLCHLVGFSSSPKHFL